jgi:hypothetical protein
MPVGVVFREHVALLKIERAFSIETGECVSDI